MKKNKLQNNKVLTLRNSKGFTLVETMVAVFILAIALTALLNLTARSLFSARYARNEITANYLMQEVVDYIRNQRDTIAFLKTNGSWQEFLTLFGDPGGLCFSADGCYFDVNLETPIINSCDNECPPMRYFDGEGENPDSLKNFYNYDFGQDSNFKRKIHLSYTDENELMISVTVEWLNGNLNRSRSLNISLLNWLPNNN